MDRWRLEERHKRELPWSKSSHSVPDDYDEVKAKSFLKFLRTEYPNREFRVLKAMNW